MSSRFDYHFRVQLHDIDAAGVVFFSHTLRHAHDAYEAFMAEMGFSLHDLIEAKQGLPLVHSEADYLRPMRHGDAVKIRLQVERLGDSSFTIAYQFFDSHGDKLARVRTTHVMLDLSNGSSMPLSEELRKSLAAYLE